MASLYKQFVVEREGAEVYETEYGFAVYTIKPNEHLYFSEFFVTKSKRHTREVLKIWNHILNAAKANSCKFIVGCSDTGTMGWEVAAKLMQKLGFEPYYSERNLIYFRKNLGV